MGCTGSVQLLPEISKDAFVFAGLCSKEGKARSNLENSNLPFDFNRANQIEAKSETHVIPIDYFSIRNAQLVHSEQESSRSSKFPQDGVQLPERQNSGNDDLNSSRTNSTTAEITFLAFQPNHTNSTATDSSHALQLVDIEDSANEEVINYGYKKGPSDLRDTSISPKQHTSISTTLLPEVDKLQSIPSSNTGLAGVGAIDEVCETVNTNKRTVTGVAAADTLIKGGIDPKDGTKLAKTQILSEECAADQTPVPLVEERKICHVLRTQVEVDQESSEQDHEYSNPRGDESQSRVNDSSTDDEENNTNEMNKDEDQNNMNEDEDQNNTNEDEDQNNTNELNKDEDRKNIKESSNAKRRHSKLLTKKRNVLNWKRGDMIGAGSYGKVFMGLDQETGVLMAIKEVQFVNMEEAQALKDEVELMKSLNHPNIVRYIGSEMNSHENQLRIFTEWIPGGSISSLLQKFGSFGEAIVRKYTKQILTGLAYLHKCNVVHGDIKGANILVDDQGCTKLADFGAAKRLESGAQVINRTSTLKGTPFFMAPEVILQSGHGKESDIWSLACTIVQMVTGEPPWKNLGFASMSKLLQHVCNRDGVPVLPARSSEGLRSLLSECFVRDKTKRPSASGLLRHPFIDAEVGSEEVGCQGTAVAEQQKLLFDQKPGDETLSHSPVGLRELAGGSVLCKVEYSHVDAVREPQGGQKPSSDLRTLEAPHRDGSECDELSLTQEFQLYMDDSEPVSNQVEPLNEAQPMRYSDDLERAFSGHHSLKAAPKPCQRYSFAPLQNTRNVRSAAATASELSSSSTFIRHNVSSIPTSSTFIQHNLSSTPSSSAFIQHNKSSTPSSSAFIQHNLSSRTPLPSDQLRTLGRDPQFATSCVPSLRNIGCSSAGGGSRHSGSPGETASPLGQLEIGLDPFQDPAYVNARAIPRRLASDLETHNDSLLTRNAIIGLAGEPIATESVPSRHDNAPHRGDVIVLSNQVQQRYAPHRGDVMVLSNQVEVPRFPEGASQDSNALVAEPHQQHWLPSQPTQDTQSWGHANVSREHNHSFGHGEAFPGTAGKGRRKRTSLETPSFMQVSHHLVAASSTMGDWPNPVGSEVGEVPMRNQGTEERLHSRYVHTDSLPQANHDKPPWMAPTGNWKPRKTLETHFEEEKHNSGNLRTQNRDSDPPSQRRNRLQTRNRNALTFHQRENRVINTRQAQHDRKFVALRQEKLKKTMDAKEAMWEEELERELRYQQTMGMR